MYTVMYTFIYVHLKKYYFILFVGFVLAGFAISFPGVSYVF